MLIKSNVNAICDRHVTGNGEFRVWGQSKSKTNIQIIEKYLIRLEEHPDQHANYVRQCRVKELKADRAVIHWAISPILENYQEVDRAMIWTLQQLEAEIRTGTAPMDPMERQLQRDIEEVALRLGKGKGKGKGKA